MGVKINSLVARARLIEAVHLARSDQELPEVWLKTAEMVGRSQSKTFTPALGTALLAVSTNDRADPLSIKENYGDRTYSIRGLCHEVLVPAAVEFGFSIRNTGREPLNNNPWFRYDHMSRIDRVRDPGTLELLILALKTLEGCDRDTALYALAAYLRYRISVTKVKAERQRTFGQMDLYSTAVALPIFLADNIERPRKMQALVAACLDLTHADVRSRRLNDPSRDLPGDVQAYFRDRPHLSVEVRGKAVSETEVKGFVEACARNEIGRAFLVVDWPQHVPLPRQRLVDWAAESSGVSLSIFESLLEFFTEATAWGDATVPSQLSKFGAAGAERLTEIEAGVAVEAQWIAICDVAASASNHDATNG